jgi:hypothetical protein
MAPNISIKSLLSLLDDSDPEVYFAVKDKIIEAGPDNLPLLEKALELVSDLLQHERLESIIDQLKTISLGNKLTQWLQSEDKLLPEAWALISSIQKSEISSDKVEKLIQQIVRDIWVEMNDLQTSFEKIAIINHILFETYHFEINNLDISAVENSLINNLLISRKGNSVSMTMLYCIIGKELNLPIHPIGINFNMFLGYMDPSVSREAYGEIAHPFLFFINIERKGAIVGIKEMDYFIKENKEYWNDRLILSNEELIRKLLNFIIESYHIKGDNDKSKIAEDLLNKLDNRL